MLSCSSNPSNKDMFEVIESDTADDSEIYEQSSEKNTTGVFQQKTTSFIAKNAQIKNNLSERWLELKDISSDKAWNSVQSFLTSLGFLIKESRRDIGFIKTEFMSRREFVPPKAQGFLTKALNSWRPELAEGAFDRIVVRVEFDELHNLTRIYFYHYIIVEPNKEDEASSLSVKTNFSWQIKPFNPMFEAQVLYQAMIFFGAEENSAKQQLNISPLFVKKINGTKMLVSINFKASKEKSWDYFSAMVYRAGWLMSQVKKSHFTTLVILPDNLAEVDNQLVKFKLKTTKINGVQYTNLAVDSASDTPLSANERKYLFKSLGLL